MVSGVPVDVFSLEWVVQRALVRFIVTCERIYTTEIRLSLAERSR